ncbi:hypothetical protein AB0M44_30975 [Streptosporangium subroseum]|uniref:hypothetical protein n=1 Tax=Streptosporangium subroseum TaxID=106412 RepID=UPI0034227D49
MENATADDAPAAPARRALWRTAAERHADRADATVRAAQADIEAQRARDQRKMEQLEAEREHLKIQAELAAARKQLEDKATVERKTKSAALRKKISLAVVLAFANIGVNAAAVLGQVLALVLGLGWQWWAAVPLALVVESVAINVGYFAHDKLIKGYSAVWLRLLSYGIGAGVGWFNYEHNKALAETADFAGVFGVCSLLSPVLWQIYSQWRHWDQMRLQGLLEERALRFTWPRKLLWAGETFFIYRRAVRHNVRDVTEADRRFRPLYEQTRKRPRPAAVPAEAVELADALDRWTHRLRPFSPSEPVAAGDQSATDAATGRDDEPRPTALGRMVRPGNPHPVGYLVAFDLPPRPVARPFGDRLALPPLVGKLSLEGGAPVVEPVADEGVGATDPRPVTDRKRPTDLDRRRAIRFYMQQARKLNPPSKRTLAGWSEFGETWALGCIQEGQQIMIGEGWAFDDRGTPTPPPRPVATTPAATTVNGSVPAGGDRR